MKEAKLWLGDDKGNVTCIACVRRCVIPPGRVGFCRTRENRDGKLMSPFWGQVVGGSGTLDPIEKKPLYHFYPGTHVYSVGGWGCNFLCAMCQNYHIAHAVPKPDVAETVEPMQLIKWAVESGASGIAFTYNEPARWPEYIQDTFKHAASNDLYTVVVTNGSFTRQALDHIGPYTDAMAVDIKAMTDVSLSKIGVEGIDPDDILDSTVYARDRWGMHIECITNVIPTVNDSDEELTATATWIRDNLGPRVPWHVTRFFPAYRFSHLMPTDLSVLERAYRIGLEVGLMFVYIGNVASSSASATYCPRCQSVVIERSKGHIENRSVKGQCTKCGEYLGVITEDIRSEFREC
ncbi:MAG TPA: AmmeMemoRadiSam system radical SAM enzyme [Caldisericia bacterium]|nr:AmmeMemoRadiSam system radical SAM enzyme [Caldisericia bacterium]HPF49401.1 AmmeMemoRadiSam system radical SAM enzyme [Caldisericia bacterium]HPI84396.1 AmmeMemoRadiSam system radical SAM enzyme [Caldisericia bacterium]HPQ93572.1 AmmeMemoRadiSam system radical SAM enzyme [Caldisericia bacterium]HRV75541.1 AmmeMemoRadiSam system radical SAM enzyme [Caldisericia bacterium]